MFNNVSQFKKFLKVGQSVQVINRWKNTNEQRIVIAKQSNAFYTGKEITEEEYKAITDKYGKGYVTILDGKYYTKLYMEFPKAKDVNITNNSIQYLAFEKEFSYGGKTISPSLDFQIGEVWLEYKF